MLSTPAFPTLFATICGQFARVLVSPSSVFQAGTRRIHYSPAYGHPFPCLQPSEKRGVQMCRMQFI